MVCPGQPSCTGRLLVLWQVVVPCSVDICGRLNLCPTEKEEWIQGGDENTGKEGLGEEDGGETSAWM